MLSQAFRYISRSDVNYCCPLASRKTSFNLPSPDLWKVFIEAFCKFLWISGLSSTSILGHYFSLFCFVLVSISLFLGELKPIYTWLGQPNFTNTHIHTYAQVYIGGHLNKYFADKKTCTKNYKLQTTYNSISDDSALQIPSVTWTICWPSMPRKLPLCFHCPFSFHSPLPFLQGPFCF